MNENRKAVIKNISVQASYQLYATPQGVITCDSIISVPLACSIIRKDKLSNSEYSVMPVVEIISDASFNIKIITDVGVTVEPLSTSSLVPEANPYSEARFYFALPPQTTGVKGIIVQKNHKAFSSGLVVDVMHPPYNYDNMLFGPISHYVSYNTQTIKGLSDKVDALSAVLQKLTFLSARGEVLTTENYNVGKDGFVRITGNPRFIRGTLRHANINPWRVDFYFSDHDENTTKTRVYIPAGSSVLLLDLITGQLCITTTNDADVRSVTYPLPLLTKARDIPVNWAWVVPTQGNLNMEVQQWA